MTKAQIPMAEGAACHPGEAYDVGSRRVRTALMPGPRLLEVATAALAMTRHPRAGPTLGIGHWALVIWWSLGFGHSDFPVDGHQASRPSPPSWRKKERPAPVRSRASQCASAW